MENLNQQIKQMVVQHLYLEVDPESLNDSDSLLTKFDLDPAMLQGVLRGLESEFGITVSKSEFNPGRFSQIKGIVSFVQSKLDAVEAERIAAIDEISKAFRHVKRGDGISLHEADVIDDYGTDKERSAARAKDTEDSWQNVPHKDIAHFYSIFPFLDPKGFRYYIPAYMLWSLNSVKDSSMSIDFTIYALAPAHTNPIGSWDLERFSILSVEQSRAVARFLTYMSHSPNCDHGVAKKALDGYWAKFLNAETVSPRLKTKKRGQKK